jgi:hypothetical protein
MTVTYAEWGSLSKIWGPPHGTRVTLGSEDDKLNEGFFR